MGELIDEKSGLGRDTVEATVWAMSEAEALLRARGISCESMRN
jgi:hypothetical protein